jgi:ferredoxin-NADP reductase
VALVYGNRRPAQRLYGEELAALQSDIGLELSCIYGDVTVDLLRRCVDAQRHARSTWFACGPPAMLAALETHLAAIGVPPRRLVTERFRYGA